MSLLRSLRKFNFLIVTQLRREFSSEKPCREVAIPVPWGEVRGKWWGPTDARPILTLHGWQDNCGSFDKLIPLLNSNVGFLAVDFPGHGYSSRLPPGVNYHYTLCTLTVQYIKNYMGWPKITLMGHSMGGITSFTYTMLCPDQVDYLICLDGAKPLIPRMGKNRLNKLFNKFLKNNSFLYDDKEPPSYTIEEMKKKIHQPNQGSIDIESAHYIIERNIAPSKVNPGEYYFTRDPRLKAGQLTHISQEEILQTVQQMTCPIFVMKAKGAWYFEPKENFYEVMDVLKRTSVDCEYHYVEGTHHLHLNNPEIELAGLLQKFINKHHIGDRSVGGLKEEMLVTEKQAARNKL